MAVIKHTAEILGPSPAASLPYPVSPISLFVGIGKPPIDDLLEVTDTYPNTLVVGFLYSELHLIFEGIQGRLDNTDMVAI